MTNDEFIADCRKRLHGQLGASLTEALDRLEALIGQGKPTPGQIGGEEALLTSKPEPVAPARKWEAEDGK